MAHWGPLGNRHGDRVMNTTSFIAGYYLRGKKGKREQDWAETTSVHDVDSFSQLSKELENEDCLLDPYTEQE